MARHIWCFHMCILYCGIHELFRYIPSVLRQRSAFIKLHLDNCMARSHFDPLSVRYICCGRRNVRRIWAKGKTSLLVGLGLETNGIFHPKLMVYCGSLGMVFSLMMISLCQEFYQFLLAQGILLGISMALATWPMLALVGQYIKVRRAAAMGIVLAGSSMGGVIWPIVIDRLLKNPKIGFPWTMRIVGFIMIPLFIFSCVAAKSPDTSAKNVESGDAQPANEDKSVGTQDKQHDQKAHALALVRQPALQLLCVAMFIIYFGMFAPFFYTTSYAVKMGFSTSLAFYTVSIVNGASFFGRILPGIVADKYGKFNCCILATISAAIIALCWTKVTSVAGLVLWSAAYGFASGVSYLQNTV